jgi:hypothetical protein
MLPIILLLSLCLVAEGQIARRSDVCALLKNPSDWNGRMVEITGRINPGGGETGPVLAAGPDCPVEIEFRGFKFPNTISITDPINKASLVHAVDFKWDNKSRDEFSALLRGMNAKLEHVVATVVGQFETRSPFSDLAWKGRYSGRYAPNGFGHLGGSPAQIVVETMSNMRVERNDDVNGSSSGVRAGPPK